MKPIRLLLPTIIAAMLGSASAQAQLFSQRPAAGQPTTPTFPGGAGINAGRSSTGTITANSRFVRGGRQPTDFVGSDSGDRRGFVGSQQARGRRTTTPTTTGLQPRPEPNVNQAQTQSESNSPTSLYPPRLTLDDELTAIQPTGVQAALQRRLERSQAIRRTGPLEVSLEGRTATLRGTVASTRDRALAELLLRLEPGVSDVQNDLKVKPVAEPIANPPALPASIPREF
ncbi:MAG: BON domain-containing protein [Planctomycetia bacterium]|nr:BON domain-containing protein [Planctomycetia bacterium]